MGIAKELVSNAQFILTCAHTRLEPIRCGSNLSPNDIWVALEYIEEASAKLKKLAQALDPMERL